jgi:hypothetical protein
MKVKAFFLTGSIVQVEVVIILIQIAFTAKSVEIGVGHRSLRFVRIFFILYSQKMTM